MLEKAFFICGLIGMICGASGCSGDAKVGDGRTASLQDENGSNKSKDSDVKKVTDKSQSSIITGSDPKVTEGGNSRDVSDTDAEIADDITDIAGAYLTMPDLEPLSDAYYFTGADPNRIPAEVVVPYRNVTKSRAIAVVLYVYNDGKMKITVAAIMEASSAGEMAIELEIADGIVFQVFQTDGMIAAGTTVMPTFMRLDFSDRDERGSVCVSSSNSLSADGGSILPTLNLNPYNLVFKTVSAIEEIEVFNGDPELNEKIGELENLSGQHPKILFVDSNRSMIMNLKAELGNDTEFDADQVEISMVGAADDPCFGTNVFNRSTPKT